ncbi:hypothetical protein BDQ12DRAFT_688409 [Crucibulum laeve]|uniref:Uncharacterized protein n=1 Tax=Crucibulum laeve TaxID=68775 RepID=A0A5C3LS68_9AGAR|nr:hypothetical protein BDQ12DRAFT_688409 [Crucibulum laeve]
MSASRLPIPRHDDFWKQVSYGGCPVCIGRRGQVAPTINHSSHHSGPTYYRTHPLQPTRTVGPDAFTPTRRYLERALCLAT